MYSTPPNPYQQPYDNGFPPSGGARSAGPVPPPYGAYGIPPADPYRLEIRREKKMVRRHGNQLYALVILAIATAGIAQAVFSFPVYLADWLHNTSRAAFQLHYGWGVVLVQALPILLGELVLLLIGYRLLDRGIRWNGSGEPDKKKQAGLTLFGSLACAGGWAAAELVTLVLVLLFSLFGMNFSAGGITVPTQTGPRIAMLLFLYLASPLLEEFIFRGMLLNNLRRYGEKFAVISSALLFVFFNFRFDGLLRSLLFGLILGFLAVRTGNIWVPVAARLLAEWVIWGANEWLGAMKSGIPALLFVAAALLAFVLFAALNAGKLPKAPSPEAPMLRTGQKVSASISGACAVLGIIAYVLMNISTILGSFVLRLI